MPFDTSKDGETHVFLDQELHAFGPRCIIFGPSWAKHGRNKPHGHHMDPGGSDLP